MLIRSIPTLVICEEKYHLQKPVGSIHEEVWYWLLSNTKKHPSENYSWWSGLLTYLRSDWGVRSSLQRQQLTIMDESPCLRKRYIQWNPLGQALHRLRVRLMSTWMSPSLGMAIGQRCLSYYLRAVSCKIQPMGSTDITKKGREMKHLAAHSNYFLEGSGKL